MPFDSLCKSKIFKDKKPRHMAKYFGTEILSEVYD